MLCVRFTPAIGKLLYADCRNHQERVAERAVREE